MYSTVNYAKCFICACQLNVFKESGMPKSPVNASRRGFFAGAASVGAVAVGAAVAPVVLKAEPVAEVKKLPTRGGGYSLSEHVKRYYKTTLI